MRSHLGPSKGCGGWGHFQVVPASHGFLLFFFELPAVGWLEIYGAGNCLDSDGRMWATIDLCLVPVLDVCQLAVQLISCWDLWPAVK